MTEYAGESIEEMASAFITSTCQMFPKSFSIATDHMHDIIRCSGEDVPRWYCMRCGSTAEFYIFPLNSCIGDVDQLKCGASQLAYSDDLPVLPTDLSGLLDTIRCYHIESCRGYPGFVHLRFGGELNYDWNCKKYKLTHRLIEDPAIFAQLDISACEAPAVLHGPAFKRQARADLAFGGDEVNSMFCPQWPREARNWSIRQRYYGWPRIGVISEVVQSGCHVVYAQHPSCKDDRSQWRLSFSFAEVILLQSWSQTQQIVYHLLRFVAKSVLIQKDCPKKDEVLSNYHLKTLMLWTCERMPPEWWNSSSVIAICSELLKMLFKWLKMKLCPNYFIPEANLFHDPLNPTVLEKTKKLISTFCNSITLSQWFVQNYILPAIQILLKVEVNPHFVDYLHPFLELRKALVLTSVDLAFVSRIKDSDNIFRRTCINEFGHYAGLGLGHFLGPNHGNIATRGFGLLPLLKNKLSFMYLDSVLCFLHVAHALSCEEIYSENFLLAELIKQIALQLKIIRLRYHNFPRTSSTQGSRFQFLRALDLMQNLTGSNGISEFQLLSLMSKVCLRKALECDDSQISGVAPAALAYMAALYYTSSEYEEAIRFGTSVAVHQTSKVNKETLNAGCLLFIDDIARFTGLCILQKTITEYLHYIGRRIYFDLQLSPGVFAHYLTALSFERISTQYDFNYDLPELEFPVDKYLNALLMRKYSFAMKSGTNLNVARQIIYRRVDSLTVSEAAYMNPLMVREAVINALMERACENMTSFYNAICKDFAIRCNPADCYRALYLYKYRHYDKLLKLCELILHEPDLKSDLKKYSFANVLVLPPLDSFFDGDVQSLLGFHTLVYYLSPLHNDLRTFRGAEGLEFDHWFQKEIAACFTFELSTNLIARGVIKSHYYLGRHFLARYLKLRCCIDCNFPYSKEIIEFAAQKNDLPLENFIQRLLLQKLRIMKK